MSIAIEQIPVQHEYVTDASFADRAARAYTQFLFRRPTTIVFFVVFLLIGLGSIVAGIVLSAPATLLVGVGYLVMAAIFAPLVYLRTKRGTNRRVPVGSRLAIGLGTDAMRIEGPLGVSETNFHAYSSLHTQGDFVILKLLGVRAYTLLPLALFPDRDLETLRVAISSAKG